MSVKLDAVPQDLGLKNPKSSSITTNPFIRLFLAIGSAFKRAYNSLLGRDIEVKTAQTLTKTDEKVQECAAFQMYLKKFTPEEKALLKKSFKGSCAEKILVISRGDKKKIKRVLVYNKVIGEGGQSQVKIAVTHNKNGDLAKKVIKIPRKKGYPVGEIEKSKHYTGIYKTGMFFTKEKNVVIEKYQPNGSLEQFWRSAYFQQLSKEEKENHRIASITSALGKFLDLWEKDIVHLDIKLDNILYDADKKEAFITDYGFAEKQTDASRWIRCGTYFAMRPVKQKPLAADFYAFGIAILNQFHPEGIDEAYKQLKEDKKHQGSVDAIQFFYTYMQIYRRDFLEKIPNEKLKALAKELVSNPDSLDLVQLKEMYKKL